MGINDLNLTKTRDASKEAFEDILNKIEKGDKVEGKDIVTLLKSYGDGLKASLDLKDQEEVDNFTNYLLDEVDMTKFPSIRDSLWNALEKTPNPENLAREKTKKQFFDWIMENSTKIESIVKNNISSPKFTLPIKEILDSEHFKAVFNKSFNQLGSVWQKLKKFDDPYYKDFIFHTLHNTEKIILNENKDK